MADVYPQEITRVLLNLISNGFYAATRRAAENADGFAPTLRAATKNLGDKIEIRIRDNGIGIAPEVTEKIFNPFFTTKPAVVARLTSIPSQVFLPNLLSRSHDQ
jgi:signal transduction histidine kinase